MEIAQKTDFELLNTPLKDLNLEIKGSWVEPLIEQIYTELEFHGIIWRPHFWISSEWFCPDSIPGVALPFYIFHSRLIKMEKKYVGFCEGHTYKSALKLLRHEVGHAFDNAFKCRSNVERQILFGNSNQAYKNSYSPKKYSQSFVKHLELNYAQAHPDEDFAESFAVALDPCSSWKVKYRVKSKAYKKLSFVTDLFYKYKDQSPQLKNSFEFEKIQKDSRKLKGYYKDRKKELRIKNNSKIDSLLVDVFSQDENNELPAYSFIDHIKPQLKGELSEALGEYSYSVEPVINKLRKRTKQLKLRLKPNNKNLENKFKDLVVYSALEEKSLNKYYF